MAQGNKSAGATHQTASQLGVSVEGLSAWVKAVPGVGGGGMPGHQEEYGHCGTAFRYMQINARTCLCVWLRVCVSVCAACVCLQSRKHQCLLFILSRLNTPGFVTDNTFFFKKRNIEELQKSLQYKKVCACVYFYIPMYIDMNQK